MKQNWLLTGVCVGSVIMAILGWTRHPDCNCPKDLNATLESTVAKPVAGAALGARVGGDDGQAAVLGRPRAAVASQGQSAPVTATIANARGPLGQPVVAGNGGSGAGSGVSLDGTSGAGGALGGWRGGGAPGGGTNTGVELGKPAFPNGTGASASSGTSSSSTSSTTGGSQTTSSTSGGTVATSSSSSSSSTSGGTSSTSGGTSSTSGGTSSSSGGTSSSSGGGKPKPDDFGPRDPNGKPHKKGGTDDFGPHRDGDAGGASGGKGKPASAPKPEHKPDGDPKKDGGSWRDRFGNGGGRPNDDPKPAVEVPEPGTFGLAGLGLAGIAFARYRRRKARALPPGDTPPEA